MQGFASEPVNIVDHFRSLTRQQRNTFLACFLGWTLDALDFFILIFCVSAIAGEFHARVSEVAEAIFLTLALRPLGAFLFGIMADRFGRRPTLIANIIAYSLFELASAFAPSLRAFLVLRACFGVAMGGEWGVGAALAFETLPKEGRGFFSGLLQEGYAVGYLLAALLYGALFSVVGWRGMFVVGSLPAVLAIFMLMRIEESPAWQQGRISGSTETQVGRDVSRYLGSFLFLVVLMFAFNSFSHGTQDLYPTFLESNRHLTPHVVGLIAILYNIGGMLGGMTFGAWSEKIGRRRAIITAALLALPLIPLWAYSRTVPLLVVGTCAMQFMVQGAWGVIPAHLNELSPPSVRGTFPGFAYQLGNLLSSRNVVIQAKVVERHYAGSYPPMFAWTVVIIATLVAVISWAGTERHGADLTNTN